MKVLILNGATSDSKFAQNIIENVISELEPKHSVEVLQLEEKEIADCKGCFNCWTKSPGICIQDDFGRKIAELYVQADLIVYLSPVTFGGYSSILKKAIDRIIPVVLPFFEKVQNETHHKPRYNTYPMIAAIGIQTDEDETTKKLFETLVGRNAINGHAPKYYVQVILEKEGKDEAKKKVRKLLREVEI